LLYFSTAYFSLLLSLKFLGSGSNIDVLFGALSEVTVVEVIHFEKL
jgi:hypothetical protein